MKTKKGRILLLCLIGHSGAADADRRIDQGIKRHGSIAPLLTSLLVASAGFDGVILKNIGGCLADEPMQLTQWSQAKSDPEMSWLTSDDNVNALREFAAIMHRSDRELILYLGGYEGDKLLAQTNWVMPLPLFEESLGTFIRMGCSIGLDATSGMAKCPHGSLTIRNTYRVAAFMVGINPEATTYIESYPEWTDDYINGHKFGAIVANQASACWDPDFFKPHDQGGTAKLDFKGEVIVFIEQPPHGPDGKALPGLDFRNQETWLAEECAKYLKKGWSVAYNPIGCPVRPTHIRAALAELERADALDVQPVTS